MAKAQAGNVWVTLQGHPNTVAVASLLNLAGVIITEGVVAIAEGENPRVIETRLQGLIA